VVFLRPLPLPPPPLLLLCHHLHPHTLCPHPPFRCMVLARAATGQTMWWMSREEAKATLICGAPPAGRLMYSSLRRP